jgi:CHAD domain-containing protein
MWQYYIWMTLPAHEPAEAVSPPQEQIRRRIERLAFQASRTAKSPGPDAVHDLRVALRRAEQALVTFKLQLPRKVVKRIRKQLKMVLSSAGEARDCDIAGQILLKLDQPGAARLRREIRAQRKTAERALLARLRRLSLRTRISRWFTALKLDAPPTGPAVDMPALARTTLPRLVQRFFDAGESAASHNSGEKLHEFRIRAKKLRYTLELFVPVLGPAVEDRIADIKSVQTILGAMNDYRSVLAVATSSGCSRKLTASLKRSERRKIRQFRHVWAEKFSGSSAAEWKRLLQSSSESGHIPRKPITPIAGPLQDGRALAGA